MSKRLLLLNLVLVAVGAAFAVQLVRTLPARRGLPPPPPLQTLQAAPERKAEAHLAQPALPSYGPIATKNLFNPNRSEPLAAAPVAGAKPLLHGVVVDEGASTAFLEDPVSKKVFGYKAGDPVAGGHLERVEKDRVVIRSGETTFEVLLRDPSKPRPRAPTLPAQPGAPTLPPGVAQPPPRVPPAVPPPGSPRPRAQP
jgi:hypothetical protein